MAGSISRVRKSASGPRSLIVVSIILVFGIGGMQLSLGAFALGGIGLAGVVGVLLNLILPGRAAKG